MTLSPLSGAATSAQTHALSQVESNDYEESEQLTAFLDTLKEKLDDVIGQPIFRPNFKAIFRDVGIVNWKKEDDDTYRLVLDSAYEAATPDRTGKTFIFEKEILMQFDPDNKRIIFPKVVEFKDRGGEINPETISEKGLYAIWAQESYLGALYTGVGYQTTWDPESKNFVSDNINDAGWLLQKLATPLSNSMSKSMDDWNKRGRVRI